MASLLFVVFGPAVVFVASGVMYCVCVGFMTACMTFFENLSK